MDLFFTVQGQTNAAATATINNTNAKEILTSHLALLYSLFNTINITITINIIHQSFTMTEATTTPIVDLTALKEEIALLAQNVKALKENGNDISTVLAELLAKKEAYATANHGIGVDGKPYGKKKKGSGEKVRICETVSYTHLTLPTKA